MSGDRLGLDLKVRFDAGGAVDLDLLGGDFARIGGADNLVQALQLRLLTPQGELSELGHPRYGSLLGSLVGELPSRENVELLRRYARRALLDDPRVAEVLSVRVSPVAAAPGLYELHARVRAITREALDLSVAIDFG